MAYLYEDWVAWGALDVTYETGQVMTGLFFDDVVGLEVVLSPFLV